MTDFLLMLMISLLWLLCGWLPVHGTTCSCLPGVSCCSNPYADFLCITVAAAFMGQRLFESTKRSHLPGGLGRPVYPQ